MDEGDRKYLQRGYMESYAKPKREKREKPPAREVLGPRTPLLPGTRKVSRCAQCGTVLPTVLEGAGQCPQCGFELHSCQQCAHFDPASRFECTQPIHERIAQKDTCNDCSHYEIRTTVEREASSGGQRTGDARKAFENLFKK